MPLADSYGLYDRWSYRPPVRLAAQIAAAHRGEKPVVHAARKARSADPSRTGKLRREYEAELSKRMQKVIARMNRLVAGRNELGLTTNKMFSSPVPQERVAAFRSWFELELNKSLFGRDLDRSFDVAASRFWGNSYANIAYRRGILKSVADIRRAGGRVADSYVKEVMSRGQHYQVLEQLHTRQYEGLRRISTETSKQIGEALARGMSEGKGPFEIARMLAGRVEKVGITRARLLARTEIISAFAEAELNAFADAGIQGIQLEPELLTAGDDRVCDICEGVARQSFTTESARGVIPLHPNCRCVWAAVITNGKDIVLS